MAGRGKIRIFCGVCYFKGRLKGWSGQTFVLNWNGEEPFHRHFVEYS